MEGLAIAFIELLKSMGSWGAGSLIAMILLTPPLFGLCVFLVGIRAIRSLENSMTTWVSESKAIYTEMSTKYDNNIIFVQNYERLAKMQQAQADNMLDVIKENVKALTLVTARIEAMK